MADEEITSRILPVVYAFHGLHFTFDCLLNDEVWSPKRAAGFIGAGAQNQNKVLLYGREFIYT
jgi:hypothetical protein